MRTGLISILSLYAVALLSSIAALEAISVALSLFTIGLRLYDHLQGRKVPLPMGGFEWSLIAFNFVIFLSLLFSKVSPIDWHNSLKVFKISIWCWALSYLLARHFTLNDLRKWMPLWAGLIAIVSLYTIVQFFTGLDLVRTPSRSLPFMGYYRPTGFYSMSLTLAYCLGMAVMTIAPLALLPGHKKAKIWYLLISCVATFALFLTLSRGVWAGALLAAVLVLSQIGSRKQLTSVTLLLALFILAMSFNEAIQGKMNTFFDIANNSNWYRLVLWEAYFEMFKDNWFLGVGWHQNEPLLRTYFTKIGEPRFHFFSHAHNNYLQILAGAGVLGILTYLSWFVGGFLRAWQRAQRTNGITFSNALAASCLGGQVIFHIGGLSECNLLDTEVTHMLFSQLAILRFLYGERAQNA